MPESQVTATFDRKKRSPKVKIQSGIGDSDGFPVLETKELEAFSTPDDPKWGFRITGGVDFRMPLTVFQVTKGGLAERAGLSLGDTVIEINDINVENASLAVAYDIIEKTESLLYLIAKNMEDEEGTTGDEKVVVMRLPMPPKRIEPPRELSIPPPERKVWHPVMWQHPPPPTQEEIPGQEAPHCRIIRNIRRFFKETEDKPELRKKHIEDMLLALPGASKTHIEERLRSMQRKLSEIAEIPVLIQSTLETVAKTFVQLLPPDIESKDKIENEDPESGTQDDLSDDLVSEADSLDFSETKNIDKDKTPESDYCSDADVEEDEDFYHLTFSSDGDHIPELQVESEADQTPEPSEADLLKMEKQKKITQVENSWPWADRHKVIYKRSNCHLVSSGHLVSNISLVQKRIKQLSEQKSVLSGRQKAK